MSRSDALDSAAAPLWDNRPESIGELLSVYKPLCERLAWRRAENNPYVDAADYLAAAESACWEALTRFDPSNANGAAGSTFIEWRIRGALVEVERDNDWCKPKIRAAAKAGAIELPGMMPITHNFDAAAGDTEADAGELLGALLHRADTVVRRFAHAMVEAGLDADALAVRLNVSPYFAGSLSRWTIARLQETPCPC